jgi:hypothetical protein
MAANLSVEQPVEWPTKNGAALSAAALLIAVALALLGWSPRLRQHWWLLVLTPIVAMVVEAFLERRYEVASNIEAAAPALAVAAKTKWPTTSRELLESPYPMKTGRASAADSAPPVVTAVSVPKTSHSAAENEDAFQSGNGRFAVADGVSESFLSGRWARHVTHQYCTTPPLTLGANDIECWLDDLRGTWDPGRHLGADGAWYQTEKAAQGSHAAFIGLQITGPNRWEAMAVGDSCLFHIRPTDYGCRLMMSFPIDDASSFDNYPDVVPSVVPGSGGPSVRSLFSTHESGDFFLLMSDAIAEYVLRQSAASPEVWKWFQKAPAESIEQFVATARSTEVGHLRDDDTTVMRIKT